MTQRERKSWASASARTGRRPGEPLAASGSAAGRAGGPEGRRAAAPSSQEEDPSRAAAKYLRVLGNTKMVSPPDLKRSGQKLPFSTIERFFHSRRFSLCHLAENSYKAVSTFENSI